MPFTFGTSMIHSPPCRSCLFHVTLLFTAVDTRMSGSIRKRKGAQDPILPHHASLIKHPLGRKHRRRTSWRKTLKNCFVCAMIMVIAGGGISRFVPADDLEKHKEKLHRHKEKVIDFANKHKHKVIQPLKSLAKTAHQANLFSSKVVVACPNGAKGYLNDDYCDCSDGRDESKTSACSHLLVQKDSFACADGSGFVYSSRVSDGVKDCADGSDEGITISSRLRRTPTIHEIMDFNSM